jgi:hypothetical protein
MSESDLQQAREAVVETLKNQGKAPEYIEDFLSMYDRNLKNIDDWRYAKNVLDSWNFHGRTEPVALRADDIGKPIFHVSPEAMKWLLDGD